MTTVNERPAGKLTATEQRWVDQFMDETTLFLGPDPEIMRSHRISERSLHEEVAIAAGVDRLVVLCLAFDVDTLRSQLDGLVADVLRPAQGS